LLYDINYKSFRSMLCVTCMTCGLTKCITMYLNERIISYLYMFSFNSALYIIEILNFGTRVCLFVIFKQKIFLFLNCTYN